MLDYLPLTQIQSNTLYQRWILLFLCVLLFYRLSTIDIIHISLYYNAYINSSGRGLCHKVTFWRIYIEMNKLQLYCAGHEKREYEATRKVRDSIQMVENAVLEKDKAIREKRSVEAELVMLYQEGIVLVSKDMSSKDDLVKRACYAERSRDEAIAKHNSIRNEIDRIKNSTREQNEKLDMELNMLPVI